MSYHKATVALLSVIAIITPVCAMASQDSASQAGDSGVVGNVDIDEALIIDVGAIKTPVIANRHVPLSAISPNTLKTFVNVVDLIRHRYVNEVNDEELFRHAMSGMLTRLDKNAEFLDETAFKNLQTFTEGSMAGIGIEVIFSDDENHWVVTKVVSGSSADMADIRVGDYIHEIGDKKLTDSTKPNDILQSLTGVAGTQVQVSFSKKGRAKQQSTLQRTTKKNETLSVRFDGEIAQVVLPIFTQQTRQQLLETLASIDRPIKGIVIDVRNNPGGVLSSAIDVASLFVSNTPVVDVVERGRVVQTLRTQHAASVLADIPVIVLQNRYSASAAEVLAVALKQYQYATIVGETSYGKGSIQSVIPIADGQAIKLTTAYYEKLNGDVIEGIGVAPDVAITGDDWLKSATELMQQKKLSNGYFVTVVDNKS